MEIAIEIEIELQALAQSVGRTYSKLCAYVLVHTGSFVCIVYDRADPHQLEAFMTVCAQTYYSRKWSTQHTPSRHSIDT